MSYFDLKWLPLGADHHFDPLVLSGLEDFWRLVRDLFVSLNNGNTGKESPQPIWLGARQQLNPVCIRWQLLR